MASGSWLAQLAIWRAGPWTDHLAIWWAGPGRTSLPYGEQVLDIPDSHVASGSLLAQLAIWRAGRGCPGLKWFPLVDSDSWKVCVSPFPILSFVSQELFVEEIGSSNSITCRITSFKIIRYFMFREIFSRDFQALISSWPILTPIVSPTAR